MLVFTGLPGSGLAQQTVLDRQKIREQKIRKIVETRFVYSNGKREESGQLSGFTTYDRKGNHLATGRYTREGQPYAMYLRTYDDTIPVRRVWHCEVTDEFPEGKPCLYFEGYRFDAYGNVSHEFGFNMDGDSIATVIFTRNAEGKPLERRDIIHGDQDASRKYGYEYNIAGDAITVVTMTLAGDTLEIVNNTFEYTSDGLLSGQVSMRNNSVTGSVEFTYDADGNKTGELKYDAHGHPYLFRKFDYTFFE